MFFNIRWEHLIQHVICIWMKIVSFYKIKLKFSQEYLSDISDHLGKLHIYKEGTLCDCLHTRLTRVQRTHCKGSLKNGS